jgi:hypothetical protein
MLTNITNEKVNTAYHCIYLRDCINGYNYSYDDGIQTNDTLDACAVHTYGAAFLLQPVGAAYTQEYP